LQNFNIELFAPECAIKTSFWGKYYFKLLLPPTICLFVLFLLLFQSWSIEKHPRIAEKLGFVEIKVTKKFINVCTFMVVTFYTLLVSTVFQPFKCTQQSDGTYTLTNAPSLKCFDSDWSKNLPAVILFVFVYVVFMPLFMAWVFWRQRKQIYSPKFQSKYYFIVSSYKPTLFYFELVNMLKRALFVVSNDFFSNSYGVKYVCSVGILLVFLLIKEIFHPYQRRKTNTLSSL
jgi:hypothetical protein